jgi:hypothetical protein
MKTEKPIYYVSARPEAYEIWGEVGRDEARMLGELIAKRAAQHFPNIEFRVDEVWHDHLPGMEPVAAYIDSHWQTWAARAVRHPQAA